MYSNRLIKAIILAGSHHFGRNPLGSGLPPALWPVVGRPVLERLLVHLAGQGIERVTICTNYDSSLLAESIHADSRLNLEFRDEPLPLGTAGCIRHAADAGSESLLLVFPANIVCPPQIDVLISAHCEGRSDLTVAFNPTCENSKLPGEPAGIYLCEYKVLEHIPKEGYFDIKEELIPEMLHSGKSIHAAVLPHHAGNFSDWRGYLYGIAAYLENTPKLEAELRSFTREKSPAVWVSPDAAVSPDARICGPAVIMDRARVLGRALIFGPAVIERDVTVDSDSLVVGSVIWDHAQVRSSCEIQRCVVDYNAVVPHGTVAEDRSITVPPKGILTIVRATCEAGSGAVMKWRASLRSELGKIDRALPHWWPRLSWRQLRPWLMGAFVLAAFLWSYWPGLKDLWDVWQRSDEYSSGLLVPFLAVYILWSRRHDIIRCSISPSVWGLFAFVAAQAFRLFGLFFLYGSAERLSIVLTIASLVLLLFGWRFLRRIAVVLLFLFLMLPWPNRIQAAISLPLQQWSTSSAVFCLELAGYEVAQEGNVIHIGQASVAVAEACNGLRMITAFFVIGGLVVLLVERQWWEKLIVFASSLPIALLCNTLRLTITAVFFTVLQGEYWEKVFHDFGGYAMMPLALAVVVAELWVLTRLTTPLGSREPLVIKRQKP